MPIRRDYMDDFPTLGQVLETREKEESDIRSERRKSKLKTDEDFTSARRKVGLSIREDMLRSKMGLSPRYGRPQGVGRRAQSRAGGYGSVGEVPQEAGGLPLEGVRQDAYTGNFLPSYKREPFDQDVLALRQRAEFDEEQRAGKDREMMERGMGGFNPLDLTPVGALLRMRQAGQMRGAMARERVRTDKRYDTMS